MDPTTVLQAVQEWPVDVRLEFMSRLWDQLLEEGWQPGASEELAAELDRRLAAHEANPGNVRTWEQVLQRVRRPR